MTATAKTITVRYAPAPLRTYAIAYDYNGYHEWLTGFKATLYKGLIWMDGPEAAAKEMWELLFPTQKKSGENSPVNAAQSTTLEEGINTQRIIS